MLSRASCSITLSVLLAFSAVAQTNSGSAQSSAAPSTLTGCVQKTGDVYTLTDESSKVTAQLRGDSLKNGRHVQVTGNPVANVTPASGATQVFDVTSVKGVAGRCQMPAASYFADPPASASSGSSHRATFISIFVVAAVVAGTAIAVISRQGEARGGR